MTGITLVIQVIPLMWESWKELFKYSCLSKAHSSFGCVEDIGKDCLSIICNGSSIFLSYSKRSLLYFQSEAIFKFKIWVHKTKLCLLTNFIHFIFIHFIYVDQETEFCILTLIVLFILYWILYVLELCWKWYWQNTASHTSISRVLSWIWAQYEKKVPEWITPYQALMHQFFDQ